MAVFDGFFDAFQDEETGEYDREYGSGDFTEYFDQIIGSGVCVHKNPDSMKVRLENGRIVIMPGYLFIQGYWLKNDDEYLIPLDSTGKLAAIAYLNLGKRMIELLVVPATESYADALVLSIIDTDAGTALDTRYNTDICGVIDTPSALKEKIEFSLNYIDTVADAQLKKIEQDMLSQEKKLDKTIKDVEDEAIKIKPSPIGTVRFSAAPLGDGWLKCSGDFISSGEYPELVEKLAREVIGIRLYKGFG